MSNKSNLRTKVEKYPLPPTVDGICSLVREILAAGLVQRVEIAIDSPVRVIRAVSENEGKELESEEIDLEATLRNIELVEYISEDASPFQVVFDMMQLVHKDRFYSVCWVTGPEGNETLARWLELESRGMPVDFTKLLGLPLHQLKSLSEDTLILCASQYPSAGFDEVSLAVKTAIEFRRPTNVDYRATPSRQVDDPVRDDPGVSSQATHQLASSTRGLRRVDWKPTGQP